MPLDSLTVNNFETGAPVLDSPALTQLHMLSASFTGSAPILGTPALAIDSYSVWPFRPNWKDNIRLNYEFKTDIITSQSGREQRRALREDARKDWEFSALVYRTAYREKMAQVTSRFDSDYYFANPVYKARLNAAAAAGVSVLSVASVPDWLVEGVVAVLLAGSVAEAVLISEIDGTDITIAGIVMNAWASGTRLHLAETIKTDVALKTTAETADVITLKNALLVDVLNEDYSGESVAGTTFNGREMFLKSPNWRGGIGIDFESDRNDVDYGSGLRDVFSPVPFLQRDSKATFVGRTLAETEEVINLFKRMKGRRGEFYMPTGMVDLIAASSLVSGQATLTVAGRYAAMAFNNSGGVDSALVLKALLVYLRDGTTLPRLISSVARSGENSVFTLSTTWPSTITVASILKISFLPVVRFATDALQIDFETDTVAQFDITVHALEALTPE